MTSSLDDLVLAVAAVGLAGSLRELPGQELTEPEARALVDAAERYNVVGVALASTQAGALRLPTPAVEELVDVHAREMTTCLRLEHELLAVAALLDEAGIDFRVLDGSAVAHLDYPDPALRGFPMLELLLRPADLDGAVLLLRRNGWRQTTSPRGGRSPDGSATLCGPDGLRLDLRTTIHPPSLGVSVKLPELWADAEELALAGRSLFALGREQRVLETCCHAAVVESPRALVSQRDLAEMVLFGAWNHTRLMRLAASWNALAVLAHAVRSTWQRLAIADVTGLSVWAKGYRPAPGNQQPRHAGADGTDGRRSLAPWGTLRKTPRRP